MARGATVEPWSFEPSFTLLTVPPPSEHQHETQWPRAGSMVYPWYGCERTTCSEILREFVTLTHDSDP